MENSKFKPFSPHRHAEMIRQCQGRQYNYREDAGPKREVTAGVRRGVVEQ